MAEGPGRIRGLTNKSGTRVHGVSGEAERLTDQGDIHMAQKPRVELLAPRTESKTGAR